MVKDYRSLYVSWGEGILVTNNQPLYRSFHRFDGDFKNYIHKWWRHRKTGVPTDTQEKWFYNRCDQLETLWRIFIGYDHKLRIANRCNSDIEYRETLVKTVLAAQYEYMLMFGEPLIG